MRLLQEPEAIFQKWRESAPRPLFWAVTLWLWATVIYVAIRLATGLRSPIEFLAFLLLLTAGLMTVMGNGMIVVNLSNWTQRRVSNKDRDG